MLPLTEWTGWEITIAVLFAVIVVCLGIGRWRERRRGPVSTAPATGSGVDLGMMVVLLGSLLPWRPRIGDAIVLVGCFLWLGFYFASKVRGRSARGAQE